VFVLCCVDEKLSRELASPWFKRWTPYVTGCCYFDASIINIGVMDILVGAYSLADK
jgi:hypothetical protein